MGFMGLKHWIESDNAADFYSVVLDKIGELFLEEVKTQANNYNTSGEINVALVAEDILRDARAYEGSKLYESLLQTKEILESKISKLENTPDDCYRDYNKDLKRMVSSLNKILDI